MVEPQAELVTGLGDQRTTPQHRNIALMLCGTLLTCATLAAYFGLRQGPEIKPLVPIAVTVWSLADLLTGFLLLAQFCVNGRLSFAVLAIAYAFSGILTWGYLLAFPGLFITRPLTPGELEISIFLWMAWHCSFPALIVVSAFSDSGTNRSVPRRMIFRAAMVTAILPLVAGVAVTALIFAARDALPHLLIAGVFQPLFNNVCLPAIAALNLLACLALLARRDRMTTLHLWLCVAMFSAALDAVLNRCGGARYSYAWDVGKFITIFTASILLAMILCEIVTLYGRFRDTAVELLAAKRGAEEASHVARIATAAKSRFLATMSHEIRTPMNGLIGMAELLSLTRLDEEQRQYVEVVQDSGQSLLRLLNDILDFSKIEAGKLDLEMVDFDLHGQVGSVASMFAGAFTSKGVPMATSIDSSVPVHVNGDPYRVRQILVNLLGNALKFTPRGGSVRALVRAEVTEGAAVSVTFTIVDTGTGIAPDVKDRLFAPFSQADDSTTRKFGGTGLGLSISKQLVDLMGGQIGVESVLNEGSSFWFTLPLRLANRPHASEITKRTTKERRTAVRPRSEKILLAEDNEINQMLVRKQFKQLGFDITVVSNGREAVEVSQTRDFDAVFMDCHMPELNGLDATREIRASASDRHKRVPIVAMTADAQAEAQQGCLDAGMDDYISKPASLEDLRAVLERWLPNEIADLV